MHQPHVPARRRGGPLLFVPRRFQRSAMLATLKKLHAWTGLWGAALFLLLGTSGVLLNHRSILPIKTDPVEVNAVAVPVPLGTIQDEESLDRWARSRWHLPVEGKPLPPASATSPRFLGRAVTPVQPWTRVFYLPDEKLTVSHVPGSAVVEAKREALGPWGFIKNLHKGVGLGVAWVLLIDTIAGALITMSITGVLLWSRLHGPRLLAGALAGGAIIWALLASVPFVAA